MSIPWFPYPYANHYHSDNVKDLKRSSIPIFAAFQSVRFLIAVTSISLGSWCKRVSIQFLTPQHICFGAFYINNTVLKVSKIANSYFFICWFFFQWSRHRPVANRFFRTASSSTTKHGNRRIVNCTPTRRSEWTLIIKLYRFYILYITWLRVAWLQCLRSHR